MPSDAFATIQVRAADGARFVLKFGAGATVADLRDRIDAEVASIEPYEIRAAPPPRLSTTPPRSKPAARADGRRRAAAQACVT